MTAQLYSAIADALRDRIRSGTLSLGQDLPTEAELGAEWSVSRGPVRNALAVLRAEGLIETIRGRPSRVIAAKSGQQVDVYVPFTRWVEVSGRRPGARTVSLTSARADQAVAGALGLEVGAPVVQLVRVRLIDTVPAMLERTTFVERIGRLLFDVDLDTVSITAYLAGHGHRFAEVRHEIDAVAAGGLDDDLLGVSPGAPLLRLRRTSLGDDHALFEYSGDRYRSDVVRFTVDAADRRSNGLAARPASEPG